VPWNFSFTVEANEKISEHFGNADVGEAVGNHFVEFGEGIGYMTDIGNGRFRDVFGVIWNRTADKDIGVIEGQVLPEPTLSNYNFPNPHDPRYFADIPSKMAKYPDRFRIFQVGFYLYERAWTLRGMGQLLMDFIENPEFAHELFDAICDYNIAHIEKALTYDIDCVYFGDDWGQQHGLIMGPAIWRKFIGPRLERMYKFVRQKGKFVIIHSCDDVDELFDTLIGYGLNCFNPFQPEVMDVYALLRRYHSRLSFHGGLSTQRTLPYGTVAEVRAECRKLLAAGAEGGYIFAPAHAVESDVPLENMVAFIEEAKTQPGYRKLSGK
jgi:uroporphyrinogen decarboxylase